MDYAIEVKELTKKFGSLIAVNGISFSIEKGKIFGFLGPNGSGKSTAIRMICGVLSPTSGTVSVFGHEISKYGFRHNIGYMSQKFSLYEDLTVEENLDFYGGIYSLPKNVINERKAELIQMANLTGKEKSLAGTLSGGWKQRLALGCAMIHKPRLLILDEPTAGVDPVSRRLFWQIIRNLSKQGITTLVSTHYMDEAESCDVVGFILYGDLLEFDAPAEMIKKYKANNLEDVFFCLISSATQL